MRIYLPSGLENPIQFPHLHPKTHAHGGSRDGVQGAWAVFCHNSEAKIFWILQFELTAVF